MIRSFLTALLVLTFCSHATSQRCFDPLQPVTSTNAADWNDLVKFVPPAVQEEGVVRLQTIDSGYGNKINLDFYSITFRKDPTRSLPEVFRDLRTHFSSFAHAEATAYTDASGNYFLPYRSTSAADDRLSIQNKKLWESANPKGAVMSFVLRYHTPALALAATLRGLKIVLEQGDVLVTCANPTDFIFSTVYTEKDTYHPVNGNRGFGIKENTDGKTWTFYSKGADRETKMDSGLPYFGNVALHNGAMSPEIEKGPDAVFQAGDKFWREFFSNMAEFLNREGLTVDDLSFIRNTSRHDYPLPQN